jgi:hypothetical protein
MKVCTMPLAGDLRLLETYFGSMRKFFSEAANLLQNSLCGVFPIDPFLSNFMLQADHGSEEKR